MKEIHLTQGYQAIVDDEDFGWLSNYSWCVDIRDNATYAVNGKLGRMHVAIMQPPKGVDVSHADLNGLHNWRSNLLIESRSNNIRRGNRDLDLVKYRGVMMQKGGKYFTARIRLGTKRPSLGNYVTAEEAALACDNAVRKHLGPGFPVNFPEEEEKLESSNGA